MIVQKGKLFVFSFMSSVLEQLSLSLPGEGKICYKTISCVEHVLRAPDAETCYNINASRIKVYIDLCQRGLRK